MSKAVIITYTGVHYVVEEEQALKIAELPHDGEAYLNGSLIMRKNIADILTLEKYYETHPNKRPLIVDNYKFLDGMGYTGIIKKVGKGKAMKSMIKGLENYITSDNYKGTEAPKELLSLMKTYAIQDNA